MIIQQRNLSRTGSDPISGPMAHPIKCIILDDSQFDRFRVRRLASKTGLSLEVIDAEGLGEFKSLLETAKFDLLMIDYRLNNATGIEAIGIARTSTLNGTTPMLMISGNNDPDVAHSALELGCLDYVSKDQLTSEKLRESIFDAIQRAQLPTTNTSERATSKQFAIAALKVATQVEPEIASVITYLQALQSAPNRKERDMFLRNAPEAEATCLRIQAFLQDLARKGGRATTPKSPPDAER